MEARSRVEDYFIIEIMIYSHSRVRAWVTGSYVRVNKGLHQVMGSSTCLFTVQPYSVHTVCKFQH